MNTTTENITTGVNSEFCPVCDRNSIITNIQNERYCIICGRKIPPYTETIPLENNVYTATLEQPVYIPTKPMITDDGIFMPLVDSVREGEEPYYKLVMSKDMFIEAYIRWIVPLLPSIEEHFKGTVPNDEQSKNSNEYCIKY